MPNIHTTQPIRMSVFDTVEEASRAIDALRDAGFQRHEINVVCSDPSLAVYFAEYVDQQPAGKRTPRALSRAVMLYAALAAVGITVALFSQSATAVAVLCALLGAGLLATFSAPMMTRASERELSDYYDQALLPGKLLVAVDLKDDAPPEKLAAADRVFDRTAGGHVGLDRE